jgi:membrane protein DedA with SNARE-associated domain
VIATLTSQLVTWIAHYGAYAVFALMALDALVPVGGELIMLYAGALGAGAISAQHATLFGTQLANGTESYVILALAGTLGYLLGALIGWAIGAGGGRALIARYGRWLHLSPSTFQRAERWFDRHGNAAVLLGRITPVVRSFISIPAGALGSPLAPYTALTLVGSAIWCFGFAATGWALGGTWETVHHDFRYADYAVILSLILIVTAAILHRRQQRRRELRARATEVHDHASA